jgi:hypothetical protein
MKNFVIGDVYNDFLKIMRGKDMFLTTILGYWINKLPRNGELGGLFGVSLQVVDVCKEVLFTIALVEVAETTEHKLGLFE